MARLAKKNLHASYLKDMGCMALAEDISRIAETHLEEAKCKEKAKICRGKVLQMVGPA